MYCDKCGKKIREDALFCEYCGNKMKGAEKKCPKCGEEYDDDSVFCEKCGTRVKDTAPETEKANQTPPVYHKPVQQSNQTMQFQQPNNYAQPVKKQKKRYPGLSAAIVILAVLFCVIVAFIFVYASNNNINLF